MPAYPGSTFVTQPNGTVVEVLTVGDEFLGWLEDTNGNLVIFDAEKQALCYAVWTDNGSVSTGELVVSSFEPFGMSSFMQQLRPRTRGQDVPQRVRERAHRERETFNMMLEANAVDIPVLSSGTAPSVTSPQSLRREVLIIHVTWSDRSTLRTSGGAVMPKANGAQLHGLMFSSTENSVNQYYKELLGTNVDLIIPATHPNIPSSVWMDGIPGIVEVVLPGQHMGDTARSQIVNAAIQRASNDGLNFRLFDKNGNGTVTPDEVSVCLIIDGFEGSTAASRGPSFWGSAGYTTNITGTNSVRVQRSFGQGTYHNNTGDLARDLLTIGILVHEMAHSGYSFLDTYDYGTMTGGSSYASRGQGNWSVMAAGSWGRSSSSDRSGNTPGYPDAYNLVRFGFVTPGTIGPGQTVTLSSHLDIYRMDTTNTRQYFLLQQRSFGNARNFDRGTFFPISSASNAQTGGLLIYHIDQAVSINRIMDKPFHMRAAILEAHGGMQHMQVSRSTTVAPEPARSNPNSNSGRLDDMWGINNRSIFNNTSDPSSALYSAFTNNLVLPTRNTPSGVALSGIVWNPTTRTTTISNLEDRDSIGASPTTLNFGSLAIPYTRPAAQTVTITNTGTRNTTLNALPSVAGYTLTAGTGWTSAMTPGSTRTFTVRPNADLAAGTYNRSINVTGSNGVSVTVNANFTVTPATAFSISVSPETLSFGALEAPYTRPTAQTVTVTNTGTGNVTLNALPSVVGYTLTAGTGWTSAMTPGATRTFTVQPNAGLSVGEYVRTINVTGSNSVSATVNASFTVTPQGTGNMAVGFVYMFTRTSGADEWAFGFNNAASGNAIEFDATVDADHTLTLTWQSGAGNLGTLHASHRDIYVAQPTLASNANRKPITIHSIRVNGIPVVGAMPTQSAAANRWLVGGTVGTMNSVTIPGNGGMANSADISAAFAAANLELRTFYPAANLFTVPSGATLEITYRVGIGNPTVAPEIITQPANQTVTVGDNATFAVEAIGTPSPVFQWQSRANSMGNWTNILGETDAFYTVTAVTTAQNGRQYRCVVSNSAGTVNSELATLTVNQEITGLPGDVNDDGVVDMQDLVLLRLYLAVSDPSTLWTGNSDFNFKNADMNGDGVLNAADATMLRRLIATNMMLRLDKMR
jgi:M6 family metalloprotease-like protein